MVVVVVVVAVIGAVGDSKQVVGVVGVEGTSKQVVVVVVTVGAKQVPTVYIRLRRSRAVVVAPVQTQRILPVHAPQPPIKRCQQL